MRNIKIIEKNTILRDLTIGGGGAVTGVVVHPKDLDLVYVRTDAGGALRWDDERKCWVELLYSLGKNGNYCIAGICLDENNIDRVYIAAGINGNEESDIFLSEDRGESWCSLKFDGVFDGNKTTNKKCGECIAVDPNNSDCILVGTNSNGVRISFDRGGNWLSPKFGKGNEEVRSVAFDRRYIENGRSRVLYASVFEGPLYRSQNGGESWEILEGSPERVKQIKIADDGTLFIASKSGLFRFKDGCFKDISPIYCKDGYRPLAVDPKNSNRIVCSLDQNDWYMPIYYSLDGGKTWDDVSHGKVSHRVPWFGSWCFSASIGGLAFGKDDKLWMTDWYAVWQTDHLGAIREGYQTRIWENPMVGLEELVCFSALTVPGDNSILTSAADSQIFRFTGEIEDFKDYPMKPCSAENGAGGHFIDYCVSDKKFRLTAMSQTMQKGDLKYSTDGGIKWKTVSGWDKNILCYNAAVSADSKDNFAVLPIGDSVYYTLDGGKTFQKSKGFSDEVKKTLHHSWTENKVLTSDKNDGNIFYLLAADGFYKSTDRAKSFKKMSSELILTKDAPWRANVESIEGFEGELWVSTVFGVWYSSDFGESFKKIEGLHKGRVSIGKGKTPNSYVLWFNGSLEESDRSIYYSEDKGESFIKVVDSPFIKAKTFSVYGDINRYLRAYIPTSGLGWKYIDVLADK
jgi:photosystem II stability/assembly factor-like uncharacterized protein